MKFCERHGCVLLRELKSPSPADTVCSFLASGPFTSFLPRGMLNPKLVVMISLQYKSHFQPDTEGLPHQERVLK